MSQQSIALLTLTLAATEAIAANVFVAPDGSQADAGDNTLGVSRTAAASGEKFPVDVLGTTLVRAGATFAAGVTLKADADGKAIAWVTSGARVAIALEAATVADQLVEVLLLPNAV